MYVKEVEKGSCDGTATPTLIKETPATAYVDGRNAIGPVSTDHVVKIKRRALIYHPLSLHRLLQSTAWIWLSRKPRRLALDG